MSKVWAAAVVLLLAGPVFASFDRSNRQIIYSEDYHNDKGGWRISVGSLVWKSDGDLGGMIRWEEGTIPDAELSYVRAPEEALGDWTAVEYMEVEMRCSWGSYIDSTDSQWRGDIQIDGSGGKGRYIWPGEETGAPKTDGGEWHRYTLNLKDPQGWLFLDGADGMKDVLEKVVVFEIRVEYSSGLIGDDWCEVNEVTLFGPVQTGVDRFFGSLSPFTIWATAISCFLIVFFGAGVYIYKRTGFDLKQYSARQAKGDPFASIATDYGPYAKGSSYPDEGPGSVSDQPVKRRAPGGSSRGSRGSGSSRRGGGSSHGSRGSRGGSSRRGGGSSRRAPGGSHGSGGSSSRREPADILL